jgi:DNA primase
LDLNTAQGKSEAVERLAPLIFEVSDEVKRAHYVQQLARMIQTDERSMERLLLKRRPAPPPAPRPQPAAPPPAAWEDAEEFDLPALPDALPAPPVKTRLPAKASLPAGSASHCLALLVQHPELLPDLQTELVTLGAGPLDEDDFSRADERAVCAALVAGEFDSERWPGMGGGEVALLAQLQATAQRLPPLARDAMLEDMLRAVLRLRIDNLKTQARTLPALTRSARDEGQTDDVRSYQQIQQSLSEHLRLLQKMLNQRTHAGRRQMAPSL